MKDFALIGAAGYIAPRHLQAIADTGHRLVAAVDPHDSVGVLDRYFPEARFFVDCAQLETQIGRGSGPAVDYVTVCSPNHLHDDHAALGLRAGAQVICEKPVTIDPFRLDRLEALEQRSAGRVWTVLQLRLLPALAALRQALRAQPSGRKADVILTYVTRRGPWYGVSWKGDESRSGGLAMNIGVHLFDLVQWLFGPCVYAELHGSAPERMAGLLDLQGATVRFLLSLAPSDLPPALVARGVPAYRSLWLDGQEIEVTGFADLHTETYQQILAGGGFGLGDARPSVELSYRLRTARVVPRPDLAHPALCR